MEDFIFSLMYETKIEKRGEEKMNINKQIREFEERINKLIHVNLHTKTIEIDNRRIDIEVKIEKINIGFSRLISFDELKNLDKLEEKIKNQIKRIILLYYGF